MTVAAIAHTHAVMDGIHTAWERPMKVRYSGGADAALAENESKRVTDSVDNFDTSSAV